MTAEFKPKAKIGDTVKIIDTKGMDSIGYVPADDIYEHANKTYTISEVLLEDEACSLYYYKMEGLSSDDPIFICADIAEVNGRLKPFNELL